MEKQVFTIDQMIELEKLGVDISKASCTWCKVKIASKPGFQWYLLPENLNKNDENHVPAFTFIDILKLLPKKDIMGRHNELIVTPICILYKGTDVGGYNCPHCEYYESNIMTAAFNMIKWCKKVKLL